MRHQGNCATVRSAMRGNFLWSEGDTMMMMRVRDIMTAGLENWLKLHNRK